MRRWQTATQRCARKQAPVCVQLNTNGSERLNWLGRYASAAGATVGALLWNCVRRGGALEHPHIQSLTSAGARPPSVRLIYAGDWRHALVKTVFKLVLLFDLCNAMLRKEPKQTANLLRVHWAAPESVWRSWRWHATWKYATYIIGRSTAYTSQPASLWYFWQRDSYAASNKNSVRITIHGRHARAHTPGRFTGIDDDGDVDAPFECTDTHTRWRCALAENRFTDCNA